MTRKEQIKSAYKLTGGHASFYDGMMTYSTLAGKAICRIVWNMDGDKNLRYLEKALSGIPEDFSGKLLEVPVGTGVLTMPVYKDLPEAEITCLDYSADMMGAAKKRAEAAGINNITFVQGDVGALPFEDESFDIVLSLNGFHAFPDKEAAWRSVLVITMVQMGICIGVSPLLAYNYGARDRTRLRESLQKTALLTAGFGFLSAAGCWFGREHLLALFLKDAANLALGSRFLFWLILASPFLGFFYLSSNYLQAAGKAFQATLVSVLRQGVLLIPALYLMHDLFGLTGIAAAHTAADFGSILAASVLGLRGYRQIAAADHAGKSSN